MRVIKKKCTGYYYGGKICNTIMWAKDKKMAKKFRRTSAVVKEMETNTAFIVEEV